MGATRVSGWGTRLVPTRHDRVAFDGSAGTYNGSEGLGTAFLFTFQSEIKFLARLGGMCLIKTVPLVKSVSCWVYNVSPKLRLLLPSLNSSLTVNNVRISLCGDFQNRPSTVTLP
jgi:hypothetical protein